jgi:hypothetical protein
MRGEKYRDGPTPMDEQAANYLSQIVSQSIKRYSFNFDPNCALLLSWFGLV